LVCICCPTCPSRRDPTPLLLRYKQLLLKQRDIMIALTARLNERDEQIMTLQVRLQSPQKLLAVKGSPIACVYQ
jgi:hypothetical protein